MPLPHNLESWLDEHRHAIEVCLENSLILPAVVLIYTVIDSLGFLARPTEQISTGPDYETWVRDYLLDGYDGRAGTPEKFAAWQPQPAGRAAPMAGCVRFSQLAICPPIFTLGSSWALSLCWSSVKAARQMPERKAIHSGVGSFETGMVCQ